MSLGWQPATARLTFFAALLTHGAPWWAAVALTLTLWAAINVASHR